MGRFDIGEQKSTKILTIAVGLALLMLIGWNLIWLSTVYDAEGFHMRPGQGPVMNDGDGGDSDFIPLMPLFIVLVILIVMLIRYNRRTGAPEASVFEQSDVLKTAGMTVLIVGVMVLLPQISGLGPDYEANQEVPGTAEIVGHILGMISLTVPLFIIGMLFTTYQSDGSSKVEVDATFDEIDQIALDDSIGHESE
jgi:hypothetical protein